MIILGHYQPSVRRALTEIDPKWESYPGIIICGSHGPYDQVEEYIGMVKEAREKKLPFYGECFGYQLACIDWARNAGISDATSEEWGKSGSFVVKKRKEPKIGLREGESWWSYYEAMDFSAPANFFVAPYHASYQSWKGHPHPLLVNFLKYAKKQ